MNKELQLFLHTFPTPSGSAKETAIMGFAIPYLPDWLADHTLLGQTDGEKLVELLSRWRQLVLGLRKWPDTAFAIRCPNKEKFGWLF